MKTFFTIFLLVLCSSVMAQTTVTGTVYDVNGITIPGVTVISRLNNIQTTTNFDGQFVLKTSLVPPFEIEFSALGFEDKKIVVSDTNKDINAVLVKRGTVLNEVVISASRTAERILESPVTVLTMSLKEIKNTASATFYDGLENLKGVDFNTNSLTFKSVNTRGFASYQNRRFVQLIDGMDNAAPGLNFSIGNMVGLSELDVANIELLPGASSALYGANAFNGIMFMNSKNPFDHQGVSAYGKTGVTSQEAGGTNQFVDAGFRLAKAFSDNFAAKVNFSFLDGTDWFATDFSDVANPGLTRADTNYNGLNIYGDEVATTINFDEQYQALRATDPTLPALPIGTFGAAEISRTGYEESDLTDYSARSIKGDVSFHIRNNREMEIILNARVGSGNTIFEDANRFVFKNFNVQQYRIELRDQHFFIRSYLTSENAGDSYDTRFTGININRRWKSDTAWFTDYATSYITNTLGVIQTGGDPIANRSQIHQTSRAAADTGRLIPGTVAFDNAFNDVTSDTGTTTGSKFIDRTNLFHTDVNYNFKELIEFAEIQFGGSFRNYRLNSEGTLFTDFDGPINFQEYGAYVQLQKAMLNDKLKFTGSLRYDQSNQFEGNVTPRISFVYSLDEEKNHNIRASYQTGFRNPSTQDQYIGFNIGLGDVTLVGSSKDNPSRYTTPAIPIKNPNRVALGLPETTQISGSAAYDNAFSTASVQEFAEGVAALIEEGADPLQAAALSANLLQQEVNTLIQPEELAVYELGYRGGFGNFYIDVNGYINRYNDLLNTNVVLAPLYGDVSSYDGSNPAALTPNEQLILSAVASQDLQTFVAYTNSKDEITTFGATLGISTKVFNSFDFGFNYVYTKLDEDSLNGSEFNRGFNTPEHKVKVSFGNPKLTSNVGFNVNWRWSDNYLWANSFTQGAVNARSIIDAQFTYNINIWKSSLKLGGANILNHSYVNSPGGGSIGAQYYISWNTSL